MFAPWVILCIFNAYHPLLLDRVLKGPSTFQRKILKHLLGWTLFLWGSEEVTQLAFGNLENCHLSPSSSECWGLQIHRGPNEVLKSWREWQSPAQGTLLILLTAQGLPPKCPTCQVSAHSRMTWRVFTSLQHCQLLDNWWLITLLNILGLQ